MTVPLIIPAASSSESQPQRSGRRAYSISLGLTVLFIFLQSLTAGEFIESGIADSEKETWTTVHGLIAYPTMVFALIATVIAFARLRQVRGLFITTGVLFVACVAQWLLGHAISTLGMDWVTPFHVVLAFVVYGLAIWLSVKSATLKRLLS